MGPVRIALRASPGPMPQLPTDPACGVGDASLVLAAVTTVRTRRGAPIGALVVATAVSLRPGAAVRASVVRLLVATTAGVKVATAVASPAVAVLEVVTERGLGTTGAVIAWLTVLVAKVVSTVHRGGRRLGEALLLLAKSGEQYRTIVPKTPA